MDGSATTVIIIAITVMIVALCSWRRREVGFFVLLLPCPLLLSLLLAFVPHSPCAMCALSSAGPLAATAASHTGGRSVGRAMPPRRPLRRAVDSPSFIGRPAPDARSVGFKPQTPLPQSLLPTVGESA